jgi:thiamine biosynthesis lipoprotein
MRAYGLHSLDPGVATAVPPAAWKGRSGMGAIEVDPLDRRMRSLDGRVEVDLGGIGKGMAVDAALAALRSAGSESALVNLGGSIGVLGPPPGDPRGWPIGIAHPRRPGEIWAEFLLGRGHVATSGDYERFLHAPEGRRHHLLDPETGLPTRGVASLTAWAETGTRADTASTALMVDLARGRRPGSRPPWLGIRETGEGLVEVGPGPVPG